MSSEHEHASVSDSAIRSPVTNWRSSPIFWIITGAVGLLGLSLLAACSILMVVLWNATDHTTDLQRYNELKGILDEIRAERNSPAPSFSSVRKRAELAQAKMLPVLKATASSSAPVKQALLFAARDELSRMLNGDLLTESISETHFAEHLARAAAGLGLK